MGWPSLTFLMKSTSIAIHGSRFKVHEPETARILELLMEWVLTASVRWRPVAASSFHRGRRVGGEMRVEELVVAVRKREGRR